MVFRVRCPGCRITTTLLPDSLLPYRRHSLETMAPAVEAYLTSSVSFRQVATADGLPLGETRSTVWGHPASPLLSASTICRWVRRFLSAAPAWWAAIAGDAQALLGAALRVPEVPPTVSHKAPGISTAWCLLWLLRTLLAAMRLPHFRWPQILLHAPRQPPQLDHTGFFLRRLPVPP